MDSVQAYALRSFCLRPNGPNSALDGGTDVAAVVKMIAAQPSHRDGLIGDEYTFCEDSTGESSAKDEDFQFVVFYHHKVAA